MIPDQIPPQILAMLLQNPQLAQQLMAAHGGMPSMPGGQGGMPAPAGGPPIGMMPQGGVPQMPPGGMPRPY